VLDRELKAYFGTHGLEAWEFDVLATLRRTGAPYELPMGGLLAHTMVTSGAVTNRIDRLEARGLVRRSPSSQDRRSIRVRLTDAGLDLVDTVVAGHLDNERRLLAPLDAPEREDLAALLRKLLLALE
jgi:DNA-binding MarR family transcriptional regulator